MFGVATRINLSLQACLCSIISGVHSCFVCKKSDSSTQRCSVAVCGKFYHIDCVKQFPQARVEGKSVTCPLHQCHTCLAGNLKSSAKATHGKYPNVIFVILVTWFYPNSFKPLMRQWQQKSSAFLVCWNVWEAAMANSVDPDQTAPIGAVCSGSTLFASLLNSSVMLGNYLQQTTSADDILRCIFFLAL